METANCCKCERPIILLWQSDGRKFNRVERRTCCVICRPQPLAHPCSVKGCRGAANNDRGARLCPTCYRIAKLRSIAEWQRAHPEERKAANNASYEKHKEERLAKRKQRRLEHGDAMRAADRARYARKQGKANLDQG